MGKMPKIVFFLKKQKSDDVYIVFSFNMLDDRKDDLFPCHNSQRGTKDYFHTKYHSEAFCMRKTKIAFDDFSLSLKSLDAKFRSKYNTCGSRFCYFDNSHFIHFLITPFDVGILDLLFILLN